ncbi:MAG TPA: crosslink repair DNA glycosylase YcaQ family protein, partial [Acidimicrobiales bacterium]|nr:crosslink repair DNA glycosylase YcaQ family protein [Acidimicrobiales bacterium]
MTQGAEELRGWAAARRLHGLLLRGGGVRSAEDVVATLTAIQAQEHPHARWAVGQRCSEGHRVAAEVDAAFDAGRILRTHVLRPTWHYVVPDDIRWLTRLSGPRLELAAARRFRELGLDAKTLARAARVIAS